VKVLVVDPDVRRAPVLKDTLLTGGAEVTVASSGSFALTMLEWNRHDVVVCRARIEDMEGHELCSILKADPGTRDVRFVLVAGPEEHDAAQSAAAGVDLVLPATMTGSAILPLIVRLMQVDRTPAAEADATATETTRAGGARASEPAASSEPATDEPAPPLVPRIRPESTPPPPADPPKRYATAVTADMEEPWVTTPPPSTPDKSAPARRAASTPAPRLAPEPAAPRTAKPAESAPRGATTTSPRATPPAVPRLAAASSPRPPASTAPRPPAPARTPALPKVEDLLAMPSGTFQGSLEVMELADLTQAIAGGGKSGRLILALPQGGGLMLFEKGRVVHAEYRNTVGEEAFAALLAACHADGAGRFCFLPSATGEASSLPRTIDKPVDRLLLSIATAIDEKG
jgi:CheY-like chemotaxis protein